MQSQRSRIIERTNQGQFTTQVYIPSKLGYEKVAMNAVTQIAKKLGFPESKVEDLKTAVCEACINAIEHGNSFNAQLGVFVFITGDIYHIKIRVIDHGLKLLPGSIPDRSKRTDFRGMGLLLIYKLMDEIEFKSQLGRNEVQMICYSDLCEPDF